MTRPVRLGFGCWMACAALAGCTTAREAAGPATRVESVTDVYHGVSVADPYRWLEDSNNAEVRTWTAAQTARSRAYLDALPNRGALGDHLMSLISQTSPSYSTLESAGGRLFAIYSDPAKQQPMLAVMGPDADAARARVIVDPNSIDPTGATAIDWYVPSPNGRQVALSLSRGGSEDGDLHVFDVETGREAGPAIPHVQYPTAGGDAAWTEDGTGIWYTRFPGTERLEADRHFYQTVWVHRVGADVSTDRQVFGDGLPRVAEIQLDYSAAAHALLITVANGDGGQFAHYVLDRTGAVHQVTRFEDDVEHAAFGPDRALYLISERNAPRRQILKLAAGDFDLAHAQVIVPEGMDVIVSEFSGDAPIAFPGRMIAVRYLAGGPSRLRLFDLDGRPHGDVALPPVASVDEMESVGADLLYRVETYLTPRAFRRRLANGRDVETSLRVTSPIDFDDMEVVRVMAKSADGTQVPVNIVRRKGLALDGSHPVLLYGYGGYGSSETPYFLGAARRICFDAGGVYAIANIRGGGEFGEEWHAQGNLTNKQNVFDDFIACGAVSDRSALHHAAKLAIMGGSNGGLLMGAVLTQHPEMFRAVVSQRRHLRHAAGRARSERRVQRHRVRHGEGPGAVQGAVCLFALPPREGRRAYPAVLLQTGDNDGRVNPMQSRKMTARLQAATSSTYRSCWRPRPTPATGSARRCAYGSINRLTILRSSSISSA